MKSHRCAVCWERQDSHVEWSEHVTEAHGAVLAEFGYDRCRVPGRTCPGEDHVRLRNEGQPPKRKAAELGQSIKTRDGTVYTPIPLPVEP